MQVTGVGNYERYTSDRRGGFDKVPVLIDIGTGLSESLGPYGPAVLNDTSDVALKYPSPFVGSPLDPSEWIALAALIGLALLIITEFFPTWLLLAKSLPQHGRMNLTWQALITLLSLSMRSLQMRSLHGAARLRIEMELLDPPPERRFRIDFATRKDYREDKKEWRREKREWSAKLKDRLGALVEEVREETIPAIPVDSCTPLIDNDGFKRYFNALHDERFRLFRPRQDPEFLSTVTIKSGFAAPLHLLTGVLARYEEDWTPAVEGYGRSIIRPGDVLRYHQARQIQVFIFDCWLLWGPSIPICTCPEWHGEVALQYGYGDENNSITLLCDKPEVLRECPSPELTGKSNGHKHEQDAEKKNVKRPAFAVHSRVSGKLKWGPSLQDKGICPAQIAIWQDHRLVLDITDHPEGIRPAGGTQEQVWANYYSAYLWIGFVMCDTKTAKPLHPKEKWQDLIPFFSHGNIAESDTYDFYTNQLARCAFEGVLALLRSEEDITLRFVCAIDEPGCGYVTLFPMPAEETIREKIIAIKDDMAKKIDATLLNDSNDQAQRRLNRDADALKRLNLDYDRDDPFSDGDYSACALPGIVNEFYSVTKGDLPEIRELRWTSEADRDLLELFYKDCFKPEVRDPNERESFDSIKAFLQRKEGTNCKNNYHVIVALDDDTPIGGVITDYLYEPNAGVIEYLVILPEHRRKGLGRRLLEQAERLLHADAEQRRGRVLDWVIAEISDPYQAPQLTNDFDPFARVRIWHNFGYRLLDFPYVQPALATDKRPVSTLWLTAKVCSNRFNTAPADPAKPGREEGTAAHSVPWFPPSDAAGPRWVPSSDLENLLRDYLQWAMRKDEPDECEVFVKMREFLTRKNEHNHDNPIELVNLGEYLGWEKKAHLHISEVISKRDPEYRVIREAFTDADKVIETCTFQRSQDHVWSVRSAADAQCEGVVRFFTMRASAARSDTEIGQERSGFCRYVGFTESLRDSPVKLRHLVTRVEERMVRDAAGASGWYLECGSELARDIILNFNAGFWELEVDYNEPSKYASPPGGNAEDPFPPFRYWLYKPFGRVYETPTLNKPAFVAALREIYRTIYGIAEPDHDGTFINLKDSLRSVAVKPTPDQSYTLAAGATAPGEP